MRVDRKWVERNLGFDPISTAAARLDLCFRAGGKGGERLKTSSAKSSTSIPNSRWPAVPGLQHDDRLVAIHRCSMAQGTGAQDGSHAPPQQQRSAATCGCAPGDMDR